MVQFFEELPDAGIQSAQAIAKGFGGGLSQGIKTGLAQQLSGFLQQKKELGKVASNINMMAKRYGKEAFLPEKLAELQQRTSELVQQGNLSAQDAALLAFQENDQKSALDSLKEKSSPSGIKKFLQHRLEDVKGAASQFLNPFANLLDTASDIQDLTQTPERFLLDKIRGESGNDFFEKEKERAAKRTSFQDELTKLTNGRNLPQNEADALIQSWIGGGFPGAVVHGYNKAKEYLGIETPEWVRPVEDALLFTLAIKGGGKLKLPNLKANQSIFKKAENLAQKSGKSPEFVIQEAANEAGVDLKKAAAGDATEINKLNKRISKEAIGSEKVTAAEKVVFNPKEAIKQRESFGRKLQSESSPLSEYFEPEKTVEHRPETLESQKRITEELTPKVEKLEKSISLKRDEIRKLQASRKSHSGNNLDRIDSVIYGENKILDKKLNELEDLKYELRHFRKRPTEAEIDSAIKKSGESFLQEARNPTADGLKKAQRQLDLDKQYIEKAQKILNRGELPGEIRPDTHIKMKQKYLEGYNSLINTIKEEVKSLKMAKDADSLRRLSENREAINHLENRSKRLKSDIVNQTDKIKTMRGLEGPSGAFYKHQLKDLRKDVAQFQNDFFKHVKERSIKQQITSKTGETSIKESGKEFEKAIKLGEDFGKNPTKENIQKIADETGIKPEQIKKETGELKDILKERAERLKAGKGTEQDIQKTGKGINKAYHSLEGRTKAVAKGIAKSFAIGVLKGIVENEFGEKIPSKYITLGYTILGKPGTSRYAGRFIGIGSGTSVVDWIYNKIESSKLKELRKTPNEYTQYIQSLKKRYGAKRVSKIIEESK